MRRLNMAFQFSGGIQGVAGAVTQYLNNTPPSGSTTSGGPVRYPVVGPRTVRRIDVYVIANTFAGATTLKVLKNGASTAMNITIPAGVTGLRSLVLDVPFSDSGLDVGVTCPNTGLLNRFECSVVVYLD